MQSKYPDWRRSLRMAQSTAGGPLVSIYEKRIGAATNTNEVMGYWAFLVGVVLGVLGLGIYSMSTAATMTRGVGYALAALAPALLMAGAVLRFPLRKLATTLVGVGLALTVAAIVWFLIIFPGGWSLSTGNSAVILSYVTGLGIIGIAGSVVPLATDPRDATAQAAEHRADAAEADAEAARDDADAAIRESERASTEREELLLSEIAGLEGDTADLSSSKAEFELYTDTDKEWRWRLVHDNGNIIADCGQGYSSKANARKGLGSVQLNSLGAEISEV